MQTAIVTGGNRGIGFATAKKLVEKGCRVVLACRDKIKADKAAREIINELQVSKRMVIPIVCDLVNEESIDLMCQYIEEKVGKIDILINNAAILIDKDKNLLNIKYDDFRKVFDTNFFGVHYLSSKILSKMIDKNYGRVVMVSSGAGQSSQLIDDMPSYRLSKYSLNGLTMMLANVVIDYNIMVCACDPGWVKTNMGGDDALRTVSEAANDLINLVFSTNKEFAGRMVCNGKIVEW